MVCQKKIDYGLKSAILSIHNDTAFSVCYHIQEHKSDHRSTKQRVEKTDLEPIDDKVKYICRMIEKGASTSDPKKQSKKNNFQNFEQRDYDFAALEKTIYNKE